MADGRIAIPCRRLERIRPHRCIQGPDIVGKERGYTHRRVVVPRRIEQKGRRTNRRVFYPVMRRLIADVGKKRPRTDSSVVAAVGVTKKRIPTITRIRNAGCKVKEGVLALRGVESWIASIRRGHDCLRDWQNLTLKERQRSQKNWNLFEVNQRLHNCPFFSPRS